MRAKRMAWWIAVGCALMLNTQGHAEYFVTDVVDAAKRGDIHAVHRLIQDRPEIVGTRDESGYTALHWAGIRAHWRIFQELVAAGAPVNAVGGDGGTPLHWTCHHDRADMVELLLDGGADLAVQNRWGRTPLHVAARRGCVAVAGLLLARGADPSAATREGWTPLHVASMSGHADLVSLLLSKGADPQETDGEGHTPAEVARERPAPADVEESVLDDFVGVYDLGGGFTAKIWQEGRRLRFREFAPDGLYAVGNDAFFCEQEPWRVSFNRGADGRVDAIEIQFLRRAVTGSKLPSPRYVGSAACGGCHGEMEEGNPYIGWMRSRHGHAYWRLGADWALFLAKLRPNYHDLESPMDDFRCQLCHVNGLQSDDSLFASTYRKEEGVGCEACHGPGSLYMDPEIMADREAFLANGGLVPNETTCRSCHRNSERFDFDEMWPKIAHGRPQKEAGEEW
ncbi:MAG: ankyrin repeat domain-containing protein [Acidobacteria bacterium]|nr:ankyrin repeat domain-containing protein [Acidobacteriota bacterium]